MSRNRPENMLIVPYTGALATSRTHFSGLFLRKLTDPVILRLNPDIIGTYKNPPGRAKTGVLSVHKLSTITLTAP